MRGRKASLRFVFDAFHSFLHFLQGKKKKINKESDSSALQYKEEDTFRKDRKR